MSSSTRVEADTRRFYYINPQSYLCYIIVDLITQGRGESADQVMQYFQYVDGQMVASFIALVAIDIFAVLTGWVVVTHKFTSAANSETESLVGKVLKCGTQVDVDDAAYDGISPDDLHKPPNDREEVISA